MNKLLLILCGILYAGCSSQMADTTSGTETTNSFAVVMNDNTPAIGAVVVVIDTENWLTNIHNGHPAVIDTLTTDAQGICTWESYSTSVAFQVVHNSEGAFTETQDDSLFMEPLITVEGTVDSGISEIYFGRTSLSAKRQNDTFSVQMPSGVFQVLGQTDSNLFLTGTVNLANSLDNLHIQNYSTTLLFDDYSGGFAAQPLGKLLGNASWYTFSDKMVRYFNGDSWEDGPLVEPSRNSLISTEIIDGILKVTTVLDSTYDYAYAGVGTSINPRGDTAIDLSVMSALKIRLRGNGTVRIGVESKLLDEMSTNQYYVEVPLTATWTEYTIEPEQFQIIPPALYTGYVPTIYEALEEFHRVEFSMTRISNPLVDSLNFEVDALFFEGCSLPLE